MIDHRAMLSVEHFKGVLRLIDGMNCGWTSFLNPAPDTLMPHVYATLGHTPIQTEPLLPEGTPDERIPSWGWPYVGAGRSAINGCHDLEAIFKSSWTGRDPYVGGYGWQSWAGITASDFLLVGSGPRRDLEVLPSPPGYGDFGVAGEGGYFRYPCGFLETQYPGGFSGAAMGSVAGNQTFNIGEAPIYSIPSAHINVLGHPVKGMPAFLAFCPDGTTIHRALMEFTVSNIELNSAAWEATGDWPQEISYTEEIVGQDNGPVGIMVLAGMASGNYSTKWNAIGGVGASGTVYSGKTFVADVTGLAQALLAHRTSGNIRGISFCPSASASWISSAGSDLRGALEGIRGGFPPLLRGNAPETQPYYQASGRHYSLTWGGCSAGNRMYLEWTYPDNVRHQTIPEYQFPPEGIFE